MNYNINGFPTSILFNDVRHLDFIGTEDGLAHQSKSHIFTGNITNYNFVAPSSGNSLVIKGLTITGDGNTGIVKMYRSSTNKCIMPAYFSAQVKGSPSTAFNLVLLPDEYIYITTTDRGTSETFVGITYLEYNESMLYD